LEHPGHDRLQLNAFFSVEAFFFTDVIDEARDVRRSGDMDLCLVQSEGDLGQTEDKTKIFFGAMLFRFNLNFIESSPGKSS
jgi:hypothetical protein